MGGGPVTALRLLWALVTLLLAGRALRDADEAIRRAR